MESTLSDFNETCIYSTELVKIASIKLNENLSSASRVVRCGPTGRRTDKRYEPNSRFSQWFS
jgi:hypothetical protein